MARKGHSAAQSATPQSAKPQHAAPSENAGPLVVERRGAVQLIGLNRPHKRNALSDPTIEALEACFDALDPDVRVVVLHGWGDHFCAGLDLGELAERDASGGMRHSRMWHRCFEKIEFGPVPVIAVLKGAVIGGGLELATAAHLRVAEDSTFYGLPEGQRGLFVGGGGSVRVPRLIGAARMADMMLTGRTYDAREGYSLGLSQYLVDAGTGLDKALALAERMCANAPLTNYAVIQALPRIAECDPRVGYLMESLMSAVAQSDVEAKTRMRDFIEKRAAKVARPDAQS